MPVEFDAATHTYWIAGARVPSVTQIIDAVIPPNFEFAGEWHMQRGKATHSACHLLDAGRLDWSSVDPQIEPRVKAWMKFRDDFGGKILASEHPLGSEKMLYAGTLDRVISKNSDLIICDIKNSYYPQARLQLAGYSLLWQENFGQQLSTGLIVELQDDGRYECHWLESRELRKRERQWQAMISVYGFIAEFNLERKSHE